MSATLQFTYSSQPNTERGRPTRIQANRSATRMAYCAGTTVVLRDLENPLVCEVYGGHHFPTTVAKWAPSGAYICSADNAGNIQIWDTLNTTERILKFEKRSCSGGIFDVDWSDDSQRIVAVGDGKDKSSEVFMWDNGASIGELGGHAGRILSCAFKKSRPYRVVTGGEDHAINFFKGPPFRFDVSRQFHTRFINCLEYAPNDALFASCGGDRMVLLFDGKTSEKVKELGGAAQHVGAVYGLAWSPDSARLLTASQDKTAKIWDVATGECVQNFAFGEGALGDVQLGALWAGPHMVTVSLRGDLSYLDPREPRPVRVIRGHNSAIQCLTVHPAAPGGPVEAFWTGSFDGAVVPWVVGRGATPPPKGNQAPSSAITGLAVAATSTPPLLLAACADSTLRATVVNESPLPSAAGAPVAAVPNVWAPPLAEVTQAHGIASLHGGAVWATCSNKSLIIWRVGPGSTPERLRECDCAGYSPTCLSSVGADMLAVGCDRGLHLWRVAPDGTLVELTQPQEPLHGPMPGPVRAVASSPDGRLVCTAVDQYVLLFDVAERKCVHDEWLYHGARVVALDWSPDGSHVASGSLDTCIIIWPVTGPVADRITIKGAHMAGVTNVRWLDAATVLSAGPDAAVRQWHMAFSGGSA